MVVKVLLKIKVRKIRDLEKYFFRNHHHFLKANLVEKKGGTLNGQGDNVKKTNTEIKDVKSEVVVKALHINKVIEMRDL